MVSHTEGRTTADRAPGRGAKGDIWSYKKGTGVEVRGYWIKSYHELHDLHSLPNFTRETKLWARQAGASSTMRDGRNTYRVVIGKPERRKPAYNTKTEFKEIWREGAGCTHLDKRQIVVNTVMSPRVP